jgi:formylglycine-generating enzyme required for sulfatase activity
MPVLEFIMIRIYVYFVLLLVLSFTAAAQTNETASLPKTLTVPIPNLPINAKPLDMILVDHGTFIMGCPVEERGRVGREWQPHEVEISQPFYFGKFEITQAQWAAVMGVNPASGAGIGDNYPVYNITWNDAQEFASRLSHMQNKTFRLPTEAEWEMACRAGTHTRYSFGDCLETDDVKEYSQTLDNYMWWGGTNGQNGYPEGTKEVGLKKPNPWGFYDIHGNVWEWCQDTFHMPFDVTEKRMDPVVTKESDQRVMKGGAWMSYALHLRSSDRSLTKPDESGTYLGLRVVCE